MTIGAEADETATPAGGPSRAQVTTLLVVAALLVALLAANVVAQRAASSSEPLPAPQTAPVEPVTNAVLFLVDDMSDFSCAEARLYLPRSSPWLVDQGVCYENATTATPVCCPARAQIQSGQLPHNNRVVNQQDAHLLDPASTVQADLSAAGVTTYGIGKNLNGINPSEYYGPFARDTGFDDFDFWSSYHSAAGRFRLYDDRGRPYKPRSGLSNTETNGRFLTDFLDEQLASGEPFFAYDAFVAPHSQNSGRGAKAFPEASRRHAKAKVPPFRYRPERFTGDKRPIFHGPPRRNRAFYEGLYTARVRSLYDVDQQMASTLRQLERAGSLDNTAVIFASDNGYADRGTDNWFAKGIPYPSSTDIPMLAHYPGIAAGVDSRPVSLVDIPATFYDVLGVTPGHVLDGHSLLGGHRRDVVFAEFVGERNRLVRQESGRLMLRVPSWKLVKRGGHAYVEWYRPNGTLLSREYYKDPGMTQNLLFRGHAKLRPSEAEIRSMADLLDRTAACAGTVDQGSANPCP